MVIMYEITPEISRLEYEVKDPGDRKRSRETITNFICARHSKSRQKPGGAKEMPGLTEHKDCKQNSLSVV